MILERIVGSIITESGPQPFALYTQTGKFELGSFVAPDEAQGKLSVIQQQRFVQLIAERAGVSFAQVRLGQYYEEQSRRWVDVLNDAGDAEGIVFADAPSAAPAAEPVEAVAEEPVEETAPPEAEPVEEEMAVDIEIEADVDDAEAFDDEEAIDDDDERAWEAELDRVALEHDDDEEDEDDESEKDTPAAPLEDTEGMLENAIHIAVEAHRGQIDKAGAPYILHPLRLMMSMRTSLERMAAVLHDVVEDSGWTLDELRREGFPQDVIDAVDGLTRREGESYEDFIERAALHPVARRVKLADLEDNMDMRRLGHPLTFKDESRLARYHKAWRFLKEVDS